MFLQRTGIAEACKTWQQMASSTMRDSTEHDSLAHIVSLFCQKKKNSSLPEVKWMISKIPEVSDSGEFLFLDLLLSYTMEPRSNNVCYTLKKLLYTICILDISIVVVPVEFFLWVTLTQIYSFFFLLNATFRYR